MANLKLRLKMALACLKNQPVLFNLDFEAMGANHLNVYAPYESDDPKLSNYGVVGNTNPRHTKIKIIPLNKENQIEHTAI
jgi:hypothetical protein